MIPCGSSQRGAHRCRREKLEQLTVKHHRVGVTENPTSFLFALHFFTNSLYWKFSLLGYPPIPGIPQDSGPVPKTRWRNAFGSRELRYNLKRFPGATLLLRWLWWRAQILAATNRRRLCLPARMSLPNEIVFHGTVELYSPMFLFKPVLLGTETFVPPVHYLYITLNYPHGPCWEKCQRVTTHRTKIGSNGDVRRSLCDKKDQLWRLTSSWPNAI